MTSVVATCMSTSHCDQQLAVTMASLWGDNPLQYNVFQCHFSSCTGPETTACVQLLSLSSLYSSPSFLIPYSFCSQVDHLCMY